eukprot:jgi/Psemu1/242146/estExt_Genewise1.C_2640011
MVFGALSLLQQQQSQFNLDENGSAKAAASALSSTVSRNALLRQAGQPFSSLVLRSCVTQAFCDKQELFHFDLTILNHLAKSFQLTDKCVEPRVIARVVRKAVPELQTSYEREDLVKQTTAGAFALSCQLRPWSVLSPIELIDAATAYDFYHAAEEICRSAHKAANDEELSCFQSTGGDNGDDKRHGDILRFSAREQQENVRFAVEKLIDTAMEARMYRRADALATSLYNMGGHSETVLLVDVPALSSTNDGVNALRKTVGEILDNPEWTVTGFSCRQDLSRLRSTPCVQPRQQKEEPRQALQDENPQEQHWISGASSVVDVQVLVGKAEPALRTTGLSRACEHFLGKPLDKSEQCSMWSGRPLSNRQRSYAALDAWVCVGIYKKLLQLETNKSAT